MMGQTSVLLCIKSTSNGATTEKRFPTDLSVGQLKQKLELIVGASANAMQLAALTEGGKRVAALTGDNRSIAEFSLEDYMVIEVTDTSANPLKLDDLSAVEKYEMDDATYDKRTDSVREFKRAHGLGRFAEGHEDSVMAQEKLEQELASKINVGDRCEVRKPGAPTRRGTVRYVGITEFESGHWVGVQYDEPFGKNDGSVSGKRYFSCAPKYGGFVKPAHVVVGDFPEEDIDLSDDEL